ncbi:MAG TPA: hypothetical protein PLZ43_11260 [bacterium]|nr:hypothetical protein [bacterium]
MRREAYWISPEGTVITVNTKHINEVISHPEVFGLTIEAIRAVYEKYDEPMGLEGKAREEIMTGLILKGWIRIRWKDRVYSYTVQMRKDEVTEANFRKWLSGFEKIPDTSVSYLGSLD